MPKPINQPTRQPTNPESYYAALALVHWLDRRIYNGRRLRTIDGQPIEDLNAAVDAILANRLQFPRQGRPQ
jgi:hypothetical protein